MSRKTIGFGTCLRKKRTAKGYSLRKFAELVGVSATYLSQVEQEHVTTPTADRVRRMAELLDENTDEWIILAGRLPDDLASIIMQHPTQMPELVREAGELDDEQIGRLRRHITRMHR